MIRETLTVEIPADCETDPERRFALAILHARSDNGFDTYINPCTWVLDFDDGENVTIARVSRRN